MASFDTAYTKYIKPAEGGYANVTGDKGGETYAGIARNYWGSWSGWPKIDAKKSQYSGGVIPRNTIFKDLGADTTAFYRQWWDRKYYGQINSQDVANLLFDYDINSGATAIKAIQNLVGVTADGAMGPNTIAAINKADATKLYNNLLAQRKANFERIVANDPSQQKFWNGWMSRLSNFPELVTPTNTVIVLVVIGALIWAGYSMVNAKATT